MEKGYYTSNGYMGYVPSCGRYILFADESEHKEVIAEDDKENE